MDYLEFEKAKDLLLRSIKPLNKTKIVSIFDALGFVAAEDLICQKNLPSFDNSAMDGYGFRYADKDNVLKISGSIFAGDDPKISLNQNECVKIMTGSMLSSDIDCIIPFEDAIILDENHIKIPSNIKKHNAIRFKGEYQKKGDLLVKKGTFLRSNELTAFASQGVSFIKVFDKPKIAIVSSGNELKEPWQNANEHTIYNINSTAIMTLLRENGFKADYVGVLPDELNKSIELFESLKKSYDLIITSGGINFGEADFIATSLKQNGFKSIFHGVNIKPGRPTLFGKMDQTYILALPGNPMAAYLNVLLFAIDLLRKLSSNELSTISILAKNLEDFSFNPKRTNVILGTYKNGSFKNIKDFSSASISPLLHSNVYFLSKNGQNECKKDDMVEIYFLN